MSLSETAVRSLLRGKVEIGLARNGIEITTNGYKRQLARDWTIADASAFASVTFGPFLARADYDSGLIFIDGEVIDTLPTVDGRADSIGPGTELGYRAVISAGDRG